MPDRLGVLRAPATFFRVPPQLKTMLKKKINATVCYLAKTGGNAGSSGTAVGGDPSKVSHSLASKADEGDDHVEEGGQQVSNEPPLPALPNEMWLFVLSFVGRHEWELPPQGG